MALASDELKADLTTRLRRIEGQVRGVQRMVEEDRECPEVLQQMAAIRAALHNASLLLARSYVARCLKETGPSETEETLDRLMAVLAKVE
jgi:DNA-binding FrmR family transcriptional regulator